jgi:hypothetical protein
MERKKIGKNQKGKQRIAIVQLIYKFTIIKAGY